MNEKAIAQLFNQTRDAVEAAKMEGKHELDFAKLYVSPGNVTLEMDEKDELRRRFAKEGWTLGNAWVDDGETTLERQVMLRF